MPLLRTETIHGWVCKFYDNGTVMVGTTSDRFAIKVRCAWSCGGACALSSGLSGHVGALCVVVALLRSVRGGGAVCVSRDLRRVSGCPVLG